MRRKGRCRQHQRVLLGVFQRRRSPRPSRKTGQTCKHPSSHFQCSVSGDMKGARVSNEMPPISAHEDLQEKWWKNKQTEVTQRCTAEGPPTRKQAQLSRQRRGTEKGQQSNKVSQRSLCESVAECQPLHCEKIISPTDKVTQATATSRTSSSATRTSSPRRSCGQRVSKDPRFQRQIFQ